MLKNLTFKNIAEIAENKGWVKNTLLLWSEVRKIKDLQDDVFLSVRTIAFTRTLTLPALNPDRERKLRLITQLYDQGITTRQLSDWFNDLEIPTRRGTKWSPKLVYMTVAKWKKRQARIRDKYLVSAPPRLFLLDPNRVLFKD